MAMVVVVGGRLDVIVAPYCPIAGMMEEGETMPLKIPPSFVVEGLEGGHQERQECFWFGSWSQTTMNA
jgi:hypothetical protein